ncbi:MAG: hypothetical protein V1775_12395 [Bacteroidota bacterium]
MTNFPILDLIAGMIFIYFLMSIISNAFFEGFSALRKIRAKMLEKWILTTLPGLANSMLNHTILNGVSEPGKSSSYLSGKNFSLVIIDTIAKFSQTVPKNLSELSVMIEKVTTDQPGLIPDDFKRSLQLYIVDAQQAGARAGQLKTELELYHEQVEKWFDSMMERVTGSYKRYAAKITFGIAVLASFALNIDSISIAKYLYANKDAREKIAAAAYAAPDDSTYKAMVNRIQTGITNDTNNNSNERTDSLQTILKKIENERNRIAGTSEYLGTLIPIGWNCKAEINILKLQHPSITNVGWIYALFSVSKFFGLMITVFAISLGAPFWFDVLNKVANLRSSLKPGSTNANAEK